MVRPAWLWAGYGVVAIILAVALNANLASSLTTVRGIVGDWLLITAGVAAWRWRIDAERSSLLLASALMGLVLAAVVLFGGVLPLLAVKVAAGLFWISAGVLELVAWARQGRATLQSPWISGASLLAGLVIITFPSQIVVEFTFVQAVWAIALGILCLLRAVLLFVRDRWPDLGLGPPVLRRIATIGMPALLLLLPVLAYGNVMANTRAADGRQAELATFYEVAPDLPPGDPGSIIRAEEMDMPDLDGRAWRVLFRSEDEHGRPTVSGGMIFAPTTAGTDRPVVAWAHGTVGMAPQCAPSRSPAPLSTIPFVNDMLGRGWVVTAPDYTGAGGTGPGEKYLVNAEQGRDLVNAVRATQDLSGTGAGNRYATYGESQGGEVALAGGALGPEYAPELELVGIGGVAAPSDVGALIQHSWERPLAGWLLGPSLVRSWTRQYPNLDAAAILSDAGREHYAEVADNNCLLDILGVLVNPRMGTFFGKDPTTDPAWRDAFKANQAPLPPAGIPIFIGHGLDDPLIDPGISAWLTNRYCADGANVTTHWMPGVEHIMSSVDAAPAFMDWLSNLLAGQAPPSNCGDPLPVEPAPEME
jgi:pimeloyl-ACP methyl ester carboxylesterase/uncharacterized membrane protein HdeD (DUF308 family)